MNCIIEYYFIYTANLKDFWIVGILCVSIFLNRYYICLRSDNTLKESTECIEMSNISMYLIPRIFYRLINYWPTSCILYLTTLLNNYSISRTLTLTPFLTSRFTEMYHRFFFRLNWTKNVKVCFIAQ